METTEKLGLRMPAETDGGVVADLNYNAGILDREVASRIKTINGEEADDDGNYNLYEVPYARQLVTDDKQVVGGEISVRATGGGASISDGEAQLISVMGRMVHNGKQQESISYTVTSTADDPISVEINRDTFVAHAPSSGTYTFTRMASTWDPALADYGLTVSGTPVTGDIITVAYFKEERGTIIQSKPTAFRYTGWNLYNHSAGYARVARYSDTQGYRIDGAYDSIFFSTDSEGTDPVNLYPDGNRIFNVPSNGYVFVNGGNDTDTYILATHSDWRDGPPGGWAPYEVNAISFANIMSSFPNGLMQVGDVADELNFSSGNAYRRIGKTAYTESNFNDVKTQVESYGTAYVYDSTAFYYVLPDPVTIGFSIPSTFTASDHGIEILDGNAVAPYVNIEYNQNLVDKLRTDVVTISEQALTDTQKKQVRTNIGAADANVLSALNGAFRVVEYTFTTTAAINANKSASFTAEQFHVSAIEGYSILSVTCKSTGSAFLFPYTLNRVTTGTIISLHNCTPSSGGSNVASGKVVKLEIVWIKSNLLGAQGGESQ